MARLVPLLGVALVSGFSGLLAADSCDLYAAPGQNLTLPFSFPGLQRLHVLRWTHDRKVVFYRERSRVTTGRQDDVTADGSLLLTRLQASAAGWYRVDVLHPNGTSANSWSGRLCVQERVLKPGLVYTCDSRSVHLDCLEADPRGVVFQWALDGKRLEGESGQRLSVPLARLKGQSSVTCSVANKVSRAESHGERPVCKSPAPAPPPTPVLLCYTSRTVKAVLAGGACLILLLLIVVILQCCCRRRHRSRLADKQELGMVTVGPGELGSAGPEYQNIRCTAESPAPPSPKPSTWTCYENVSQPDSAKTGNSPAHLSSSPAAEVKQQPSPVPKPRTKAPLSPNTYTHN